MKTWNSNKAIVKECMFFKRKHKSSAEAVEVLTSNLCSRLGWMSKQINEILTNPEHKVIALHECLLFLIHLIDRTAFWKGVPQNQRSILSEGILLGLLSREILPPKIEERLIKDGVKPSLDSFGVSRSIAIESLLPLFRKEATESDEYFRNCTEIIGKFPSDERGLVNKLITKISERCSLTDLKPESLMLTHVVVASILNKELAKTDNESLEALKAETR